MLQEKVAVDAVPWYVADLVRVVAGDVVSVAREITLARSPHRGTASVEC